MSDAIRSIKLNGNNNKHNNNNIVRQMVLSPDMSLATVRAYIWKKSDDLVLNYKWMRISGKSFGKFP
ncbi:hypothetical protein TorRG33x02_259340 [Trema orientale]|uniref:Uncharacterized protein n=1 Tax=Trema orientale TaxID=63057 RepID=A0A2P5D8C9_TREOI|nr:hypothetical protein TorRG33x02_259340 [Trema orientale]